MSEVRCSFNAHLCQVLDADSGNHQDKARLAAPVMQGKAYKVSQAEVSEDESGTTNYVFTPASTEDVLSDKAAHLEVIRQVNEPSCSLLSCMRAATRPFTHTCAAAVDVLEVS